MRCKLTLLALTLATTASAQVNITVDLNHPLAPWKPITAWFGYDESNYTTAPNGRALLRELHDAYPVAVYIRAHHLLTSGNGVPELKWSSTNVYTLDAAGQPVYDFKILDQIFDAFRDAGVRPMVEFGFMPEALASGPPPYQTHYPKTLDGSVQSPPKDFGAWQELCRVFTAHMVTRYGHDETAAWYWEVWNEPNISYWHGTEADYNKLYDFAVAGIRAALPEARVGGPATTSPRSPQASGFLDAFLKHVANDKSLANHQPIPLDFISFHAKGSPKVIDGHVRMSLASELTDADKGFALVASYPQFRTLPIILSEADPEGCAACSAKENPSNNYRNGTLYPVYTAAAIKSLLDLEARHHVNLLSMLTWSFEFEDKDFFQGFRSLATNTIDKPVLNIFRMAGLMSGQRVATTSTAQVPLDALLATGTTGPSDSAGGSSDSAGGSSDSAGGSSDSASGSSDSARGSSDSARGSSDIDALATLDHNSAAILLWNYHDDDLPTPAASIDLQVLGLPATTHRVLLQHFRIDDTHSNAYTVWKSMGSPQQPTPEQLTTLKHSAQLELLTSPTWLDVSNSHITLPFTLPRQATSLVLLSW